MKILDKIVDSKRRQVSEKKSLFPVKLLERSIYFETKPLSLKKYLLREDKSGIIAEIKRKSPSRGVLKNTLSIEKVSIGYMQAGAAAISVLTDEEFFGGRNEDLTIARRFNFCPILRKEFIIDEYQIVESKSIGADAVLLIASILTEKEMVLFSNLAKSLGMEVLLEIHSEEELSKVKDLELDLVGVNNRNLDTLEVSLNTSKILSEIIPERCLKVSESGINAPDDILSLKEFGYKGFLIGEFFMKHSRPEEACKKFIDMLSGKEKIA